GINFDQSYLELTGKNKLIFDIGSNKGNKVKVFLKMGYKVVALEPEKTSHSTLSYRYKNNKNVTIVNKGVSYEEGVLKMYIASNRSGFNTLSHNWVESLKKNLDNVWDKKFEFKESYDVPVTTLEHLIDLYGVPYFIKIDVEGFELNVLKGLKSTPHFISFEANLPDFVNDTIEII